MVALKAFDVNAILGNMGVQCFCINRQYVYNICTISLPYYRKEQVDCER